MFNRVRKFLDAVSFRELDRRQVRLDRFRGSVVFKLRGNEKTGERHALLEVGSEAAIQLDAKELEQFIRAAQAIHTQML